MCTSWPTPGYLSTNSYQLLLMNSIFVLLQDENKGDKVICVGALVQIHQVLFPKMWKQVLVWALNAVLIVAVGVAWVLVGDRQGRHMV